MAVVYRDDDVDLSALSGRRVAVVGYDRLGEAHALCLRDSGVDVVVGLENGDRRRATAEGDGFPVAEPAEAVASADVVAVTVRRAGLPAAVSSVRQHVRAGATLILPEPLSDGSGSTAGVLSLQAAPLEARRRFVDGRGVPAIVAVGSGAPAGTLPLTLAYSRALGCTRAGVVLSSPGGLAHATAFARSAIGAERLSGILLAALTVLADAGCDDDVAVLSCWTAVREAADALAGGAPPPGGAGSADAEELLRLRRLDAELRFGAATAGHPA